MHVRKRCPQLGVEHYKPEGFKIREVRFTSTAESPSGGMLSAGGMLNPDLTNNAVMSAYRIEVAPIEEVACGTTPAGSMNAGRAAMIAAAPAYLPPKAAAFDPQLGPLRSGSNDMPLGARKPKTEPMPNIATINPVDQPNASHVPPPASTTTVATAVTPTDNGSRNKKREREIWTSIESHVRGAVEETAAKGKPMNGTSNRTSVHGRVDAALGILKPVILGQQAAAFEINAAQAAVNTYNTYSRLLDTLGKMSD